MSLSLSLSSSTSTLLDQIIIDNIKVECVVGCNPDERIRTQIVYATLILYVDISECGRTDALHHTVNYALIAKRVISLCRISLAYTLESLATSIAKDILFYADGKERIMKIKVRLEKPEALKCAKFPAVEIERTKEFFLQEAKHFNISTIPSVLSNTIDSDSSSSEHSSTTSSTTKSSALITAYLAIGSNIGNRVEHIHEALQRLPLPSTYPSTVTSFITSSLSTIVDPIVKIIDTSFLYETPPAYVIDQPAFLNGAIKIETNLSPHELLKHIKINIEESMKREKTIRYGPRCIDVDILFYGTETIQDKDNDLQIPHLRIAERDFVLGPLNDIANTFVHPSFGISIQEMLYRLPSIQLTKIIPIASVPSKSLLLGKQTYIMGILNITPDSFSDGNTYNQDIPSVLKRAQSMINAGVHILDIGGQSTRPNSELLSPEIELLRVIPVIKAIKKEFGDKCPLLSIDTFYAQVAKEAVEAGVHIVNDVSGGTMDQNMISTVQKLNVPYIIMHMRGTPQTMNTLTNYSNSNVNSASSSISSSEYQQLEEKHVILDIQHHLQKQVNTCINQGMYRWNIILDPGIGFAKNIIHNLAILRPTSGQLIQTTQETYLNYNHNQTLLPSFPLLYGPSRKSFIGTITKKTIPSERVMGTAAAITASIHIGADMVRVHDVEDMIDVVKVADAIYRGYQPSVNN